MIFFIGDVHGQFSLLNNFINRKVQKYKNSEIVPTFIQCGDFGIWPPENFEKLKTIKTHGAKLYFVPGNHENWDEIDKYERGKIHEIEENIFLCSFGSKIEIEGKKILFVGGADSIDKHWRTKGISWWSQEIITNADMNFLFDEVEKEKIDIIVSHTCPSYFHQKLKMEYEKLSKNRDPSCYALDRIFELFNPDKWVFCHYHINDKNIYKNCFWECLNHISSYDKFWSQYNIREEIWK